MPRELCAILPRPGFDLGDERSAAVPADGQAILGRHTADLGLHVHE